MFHFYTTTTPLRYTLGGQFVSTTPFTHARRQLDDFVLLVGHTGELSITQNNTPYVLAPEHYLLLAPDFEHFGTHPSEGPLSFYWCHFSLRDYDLVNTLTANQTAMTLLASSKQEASTFIFPLYGKLHSSQRIHLLMKQLLDFDKSNYYTTHMMHYTLSLIAMELSQNYMRTHIATTSHHDKAYCNVIQIAEWIKLNATSKLTALQVAQMFNYHPDYLSTLFKKYTGQPLIKYINEVKINYSLKLLCDFSLSIKEVAYASGFEDEKYFMKYFKKTKGLTPSQYRHTFFKSNLNKI